MGMISSFMGRREKVFVAIALILTYATRESINNFKMSYFLFAFGSYTIGIVFFTYYCMLADPSTSRLAHLFTIDLPAKVSKKATELIGKENVALIKSVGDRFLYIIYCTIVFGSWLIIFFYTYQWIDETEGYVSSYHKSIGYLVFLSCVTSWQFASRKSPGIITSHTIEKYDNYPYDDVLFVKGRICPTVGIPKLARSKFDRFTGVHISKFDHFCGWLNNAVGEENYRWFLLFLLIHVGQCAYGAIVVGYLFQYEIEKSQLWQVTFYNRSNGEEFKATWYIVLQYLFSTHKVQAGLFLIMVVMGITLGLFLGYHIWLASRGMTTNEASKWSQVKKWHQTELKRFKDAVAAGLVVEHKEDTSATKIVVSDGDITCTGAVGNSSSSTDQTKKETEEEDEIAHPGPMPKNIYNQGLVENWRDIIFPRSLRPEAVDRYRKSVKERGDQPPIDPKKSKAS